ncbi:HPr family phosphocarrier protein [Lachnospiraceae bacterium MD308]|jgi:phosphotransferase system HPr-like phosphotransfer protein|nr:HPr family phosphocarrier protein [Lachnospiraceae bacterium MD308]MCI8580614.1 HPr family phosphocarrier protein [Dorea sp.]
MRKKTVMFRKIDDMLDFIKKVENYPFDMDMKSGRFTVDAKSLFGILNLGLEKKIELKVYDEDCDALFEDIAPYVTA